jgi:hypothetical protein
VPCILRDFYFATPAVTQSVGFLRNFYFATHGVTNNSLAFNGILLCHTCCYTQPSFLRDFDCDTGPRFLRDFYSTTDSMTQHLDF